jgi:hypothetical protein
MFQFPEFAAYGYVFTVRLGHDALRVSPFGNLRIKAC